MFYLVNVMLNACLLVPVSLLQANMVVHVQDPCPRFLRYVVGTCGSFRSSPIVASLGFIFIIIELISIEITTSSGVAHHSIAY